MEETFITAWLREATDHLLKAEGMLAAVDETIAKYTVPSEYRAAYLTTQRLHSRVQKLRDRWERGLALHDREEAWRSDIEATQDSDDQRSASS